LANYAALQRKQGAYPRDIIALLQIAFFTLNEGSFCGYSAKPRHTKPYAINPIITLGGYLARHDPRLPASQLNLMGSLIGLSERRRAEQAS
jgi:hypothetical protein